MLVERFETNVGVISGPGLSLYKSVQRAQTRLGNVIISHEWMLPQCLKTSHCTRSEAQDCKLISGIWAFPHIDQALEKSEK